MSTGSEAPEEEVEEGAPAWLATFADLMSLLMCFFVLLLSFSEIDLQKFKQVAGSMEKAFGVQRDVSAADIPKAESVIASEFSPGKPEHTVFETVRQQTSDDSRAIPRADAQLEIEIEALAEQLRKTFQEEIEAGVISVSAQDYGVKMRIRDEDAFPSGSASLQSAFVPVLDKLRNVLDEQNGKVIVSGHTDDVPIRTATYPSNWVLSSARAASVVHHLAEAKLADPSQIEIRAYADTRPLVSNDSAADRARNRRVEIDIGMGVSAEFSTTAEYSEQ